MIDLVPGRVVCAKYRLERELARGGMGSVWIAHHLQLDSLVAVKFMDPEYAANASARLRFEREAKAAAQLRTPNVVQIYDHGVEADTPYIVMELLEGEDLNGRLKRERLLTLPAMSAILDQLVKGLQRAHDIGFVHRDLKPGNIFLAKGDDGDIVKILDFGIAKALGAEITDEATKTGQVLGSPHYMSPEQAKGSKTIDHRSDLWSVGVILFRAITGKRPFTGDTFGELIIAICTETPKAPSALIPHLPPSVDRFFERAFARDPNQRFQGAREMAKAFAALGEGTDPGWLQPRISGSDALAAEPSNSGLLGRPVIAQSLASSPEGTPAPAQDHTGGTLTNASGVVPAPRRPQAMLAVAGAIGALLAVGVFALRGTSAPTPPKSDAALVAATNPPATASAAALSSSTAPSNVPVVAPVPSATAPAIEAGIAASTHVDTHVGTPHGAGHPLAVSPNPKTTAAAAAPTPAPPPTPKETPNLGY